MDAWYQCENPYRFVAQDVLDRADSVRAIKLFSKEVLPRLREIAPVTVE